MRLRAASVDVYRQQSFLTTDFKTNSSFSFFCSRFVQTIAPFIPGIKTQCNESRRMNYSRSNPLSRRMGRINECLSLLAVCTPSAHWRIHREQNSRIGNAYESELFPEFSILDTPLREYTVLTRSSSKPIQLQPSPPR